MRAPHLKSKSPRSPALGNVLQDIENSRTKFELEQGSRFFIRNTQALSELKSWRGANSQLQQNPWRSLPPRQIL